MPKPTQEMMMEFCRQLGPKLDVALHAAYGERLGFMVFVFDFGNKGALGYLSNAQRDDMLKVARELVTHLETTTTKTEG